MAAILHSRLPVAPWMQEATRRLPGVQPLAEGEDWLAVDEAYAGQMARRDSLLAERPDEVHALLPEGRAGAEELLAFVLDKLALRGDFQVAEAEVIRPDGQPVRIDTDAPLMTLGRLVQQDLCILTKQGDEHVLTGAVLCFPASWSLAEKIGRPLTRIHDPVAPYDGAMAKRVQRLFDMARPDRPLWRVNALFYDDPELFQPRRTEARRPLPGHLAPYLRSERQTILRLPGTQAMVFSIHTILVAREALTEAQRDGLDQVAYARAAE